MIDPNDIPDSVRFAPEDHLNARGRNNYMGSSGIHIAPWGYDHTAGANTAIALFNVTTKDTVSDGARLVLPVTAIPELIEILQRFYAGPLGTLALSAPQAASDSENNTTVEEY